jgi:uncharacterized protein
MSGGVQKSEQGRSLTSFSIVGILVLISLWYYSVNPLYMYVVLYIWFGFAYGMLLQWGRFCFASAFRDLFAMGITRMFVGIMIAMGIFSVIMSLLATEKMSTFHPGPIGIHEIIGGAIFGVGMVFAGGCASGTLYKCGEGNGTSMIALIAISFSQAIFVGVGGYFDKYFLRHVLKMPTLVLSDLFPSLGSSKYLIANTLLHSFLPIILLLLIVYIVVARKSIMKRLAKTTGQEPGELLGFWSMITASNKTTLAGLMIGVLAGFHVLAMHGLRAKYGIHNFGEVLSSLGFTADVSSRGQIFDPGYWYITSQEAQFGAWFLEKAGINMHDNLFFGVINGIPALWRNPALWMSIGIILGAMSMALLNNEFKFKRPNLELMVWGLLGGTLMGLGARVALGCNIGAFFIRVAGGDPGGWLFAAGMAAGVFGGLRVTEWWTDRQLAKQGMDLDLDL